MRVTFSFPRNILHPGQLAVLLNPARFKVVAAGRQWGKSKLGAFACILYGLVGKRAWWVSPTYKMALMGWRELRSLARHVPGVIVLHSQRLILFPSGGYVGVRSSQDPDSLRGETLDFVYMDEAAFQPEYAWTHALRPTLLVRRGSALFGSSTWGFNWFHALWMRSFEKAQGWASWQFTSYDNPYLSREEIRDLEQAVERGEYPKDAFEQEYLAMFKEDGAGVFRNTAGILSEEIRLRGRRSGAFHVIGWDPAKFRDFNAVIVLDVTNREVVYVDRSQRIDLTEQLQKIAALAKKYPGRILMDATRDEGLYELARKKYRLRIEAVRFRHANKQEMVTTLQAAIETARFKMPTKGTEVVLSELRAFRYELSKFGLVRYSAPAGKHDDYVTALGLCVLGMKGARIYDQKPEEDEGVKKPPPAVLDSASPGWDRL